MYILISVTIVLKAIAQKLTDCKEIISVLRAIYLSLIEKGFIVDTYASDDISSSNIESVKNNLKSLESKLKDFPFNEAENVECQV